jgi:hypothetical protein
VPPEGLGKLKKNLIGYRTRNLPVCSIVPEPLRYRVPDVRTEIITVAEEMLQLLWVVRPGHKCVINVTEPLQWFML